MLDSSIIARLPKVVLHDHLDGDLRPETIIEISKEIGYRELPTEDPKELRSWFYQSCNSGSLEKYLRTFDHTIAVMQTRDHIARVARECVIDLAAENVIYAEVRGAPELFTKNGLSIEQVVDATVAGYREGMEEVRNSGKQISVNAILCAMRHENRSLEVADIVIRWNGRGVVGFDIAGAEKGFPASNHKPAFDLLFDNGIPFTIHAGEADGISSVLDAIENCRATRIGHGVHIADDIKVVDGTYQLSDYAKKIRDSGIHLEMAPTSNLQTGIASTYKEHPIGVMKELGFNIGINTDNRLMSSTTITRECFEVAQAFEWDHSILASTMSDAATAAFISREEKEELKARIAKGYALSS